MISTLNPTSVVMTAAISVPSSMRPLVSSQTCRSQVDLVSQLTQPILIQLEPAGRKRIGLQYIAPNLHEPRMYLFNHRRLREHQVFVAPLSSLPAIILCSQLVTLYISPHRAIKNEHTMCKRIKIFAAHETLQTFSIYSASAFTNSRQKSGMSATTRPHTIWPSRKAGSFVQIPPALVLSSLMPVEPTALRPFIMPAEIGTHPP